MKKWQIIFVCAMLGVSILYADREVVNTIKAVVHGEEVEDVAVIVLFDRNI